jgi:rubredoxin
LYPLAGITIKGESAMQKWRCTVCDYVYDPAEGDIGNGIEPGTHFEELPDEWVCPICGDGKDLFVQV